MKVAYISDLHLDFWLNILTLDEFIHMINPKYADLLLIAGDLSHYNEDSIEFCVKMKEIYKDVVIVEGNHDKYLVSNKMKKDFNYSSINKSKELKDLCNQHNIIYLDGDVVNVQGLNIGGCSMWYDMTDVEHLYQDLNDKDYILSFDTQEYYNEQVQKLKSMENLDIFLSHVSPVLIPDEYREEKFIGSKYNVFFESNNIDNIKCTNAKHCIFGHIHDNTSFVIDNINFYVSAIGYPKENKRNEINYFNIEKE